MAAGAAFAHTLEPRRAAETLGSAPARRPIIFGFCASGNANLSYVHATSHARHATPLLTMPPKLFCMHIHPSASRAYKLDNVITPAPITDPRL